MLCSAVPVGRHAACALGLFLALAAVPADIPTPSYWTVELASQDAGGDGEARTFQRIKPLGADMFAEYGFQNFNRDLLRVSYKLSRKSLNDYDNGFGYRKSELDAIEDWHNQARTGAYNYAVKNNKGQAALDAAYANLKKQRDEKVKEYMASRGFKILRGNVVKVDMPLLVKKNGPLLRPLAQAFDTISQQRKYGSENLVGAATSLVQTAMEYRVPPTMIGDRNTGGLLPPVKALMSGWGDCDSKTGLLGSILVNFPHMRMVGLAVPGHYLMAVLRIPGKGELFVEHEGLQYVLIEPAGPAWLPPGTVGRDTVALLNASEGYAIEPFF